MIVTKILFCRKIKLGTVVMLLAEIVAAGIAVAPIAAQSAPARPEKPVSTAAPTTFQVDRFAGRARKYYSLIWGIDSISVKAAESGELIRFSYRVLDPEKAKPLHDKKIEPKLIDPVSHLILVIPSLEKVGQLRQTSTPEAGRSYWMAFSNPHRDVKKGDRVNVVIGQFHADGLVVD